MNTTIYYFSGTGNSLLMARKIAERIEDARVKHISWFVKDKVAEKSEDSVSIDNKIIGFVFPVYYDDIPKAVKEAINTAHLSYNYLFAVTTSGGMSGNVINRLNSYLHEKGNRLDYWRSVDMAENSIALRTPESKEIQRFEALDSIADEIARAVKIRTSLEPTKGNNLLYSFVGKTIKTIVEKYYRINDKRIEPQRCSKCKLCEKVCPTGNISLDSEGKNFSNNCEQCFACINWCPQKAIIFGRVDPMKKQQYTCQGISASDIINAR